MTHFFETKIKYEKDLGDGKIKVVTETYLVDAMSFIEAETRITEEMQPYISGEFLISEIKRFKANEYLFDGGDRYYKAKLIYTAVNELGDEKKTTVFILVQADSTKDANEKINVEMKKTSIDYEIHTVAETPILDMFIHEDGGL